MHAVPVSPFGVPGAIMVGKTNMDQFAAGLVGTRTPFGTVPNAFDSRYLSCRVCDACFEECQIQVAIQTVGLQPYRAMCYPS